LQGNTGHTATQREKVERSHFIVAARQRVVDEFHGDVQSALASSRHGQFGGVKGSSGMSAEDLKAAQDQRTRDQAAESKRGREQVTLTNQAWTAVPMAVRKRVLADPHLTLAQAQSGVQQQPVQESGVQQKPDFDFTNDDDDIEDI
jgi:hypothetical protein